MLMVITRASEAFSVTASFFWIVKEIISRLKDVMKFSVFSQDNKSMTFSELNWAIKIRFWFLL